MNKLFKNNSEFNKSSPVKLSSHHLLAIEGMQKTEIQKLHSGAVSCACCVTNSLAYTGAGAYKPKLSI